jgi:hypothetical protein
MIWWSSCLSQSHSMHVCLFSALCIWSSCRWLASIMQNDIFHYTFLTQLWRLSLQSHRSLLESLEPSFVDGMLCRSIGWQIIYWVLHSVFRFGSYAVTLYNCLNSTLLVLKDAFLVAVGIFWMPSIECCYIIWAIRCAK